MNQDRLDDLEGRVEHLETGNGWHEWGKYVLKKLDDLSEDNKTARKELCKKMDDMEEQNTVAHREIHRKLDNQGKMCADRPINCAKTFVQARTLNWLIIVLTLVIGSIFTIGIQHITADEKHVQKKPAIEQKIDIHKEIPDSSNN